MTHTSLYSIGELARRTGTTPRTIRYYTTEGLLPAPVLRGKYTRYGDEHLDRLRLIAQWRQAYLPLREIKRLIKDLAHDQIRALLDAYEQTDEPPAPTNAVESLPPAMFPPHLPTVPKLPNIGYPMAPVTAMYDSLPTISADASAPESEPEQVSLSEPPTAQLGYTASLSGPAAPSRPGGFLSHLIPKQYDTKPHSVAAAAAPAETWQRIILAPGVELHLREPVDSATRERLEQLIARVRELF